MRETKGATRRLYQDSEQRNQTYYQYRYRSEVDEHQSPVGIKGLEGVLSGIYIDVRARSIISPVVIPFNDASRSSVLILPSVGAIAALSPYR